MRTVKIKHRKNLISIVIFLLGFIAFTQNSRQKDKLSFHSFSITPLETFFIKHSGGASITGDVSYAYNRNIFTFSATVGEELSFWGRGFRYQQISILYGRELGLSKRFFLDTHAGIGLIVFNDLYDTRLLEAGIPLVTKIRYKTGDKFSIGLKFQANINSAENVYSAGLLLQWNYL